MLYQQNGATMSKNHTKYMYFIEKTKDLCGFSLGVFSILLSLFSDQDDRQIWLLVISIILVILFIICIIDANSNYRYIKRQMAYIRQAEHSIILVMRSVSPEKTHRYYRKFDEELERAIKQKDVKVRALAPYRLTENRLKGAKQMHDRGIHLLFSKKLVDMNLSYILIDGKYLICSQQRIDTIGPSRKCAELVSEDIGEIITADFESLWDGARPYSEYCKDCNDRINSFRNARNT